MKKVLITVFMLSSFFLFFALLTIYQEKDESDLYHLFGLRDKTNVSIEFTGDLSGFSYDILSDDVYALVKESDSAVIAVNSDYSTKTFTMYVAYNGTLNDLFETNGLAEVQFDGTERNIHFSSDGAELQFPMINKAFHVDIYSFDQYDASSGNGYFSLSFYGENATQIAEKITKKYGQYQPVIQNYTQAEYDYVTERDHRIRYYLYISITLLFIIMVFTLSDHMKDISIYRLNGYGTLRICATLFLKTMIFMWISGFILLAVLFLIFVGFLNDRSMMALRSMLWGYSLLSLSLIPVIVIPVYVMGKMSLVSLLKGRSFNTMISLVMFVLCFPVILYCTADLIPKGEVLIGNARQYMQLLQNKKWYDDTLCFAGYTKEYMHLSTNFVEMSSDTDDPAYQSAIDITNAFEEAGAWYVSSSSYYGADDERKEVLILNENSFIDTGKNLTAYDTVKNYLHQRSSVLLMNTYLYEADPVLPGQLYEGLDENTAVVLDPSFEGMSIFGDTRADIVVIVKNGTPMRNKTIFNHIYVHDMQLQKLNEMFAVHGMADMVEISDMEGEYILYRNSSIEVIKNILLESFPSILLLVFTAFSYHVLYRNANVGEIGVKRLFGYGKVRIYYTYIFECALFYICAGLFLQEYRVAYFGILHLCIVWILIYFDTKKLHLVSMLKGEET